MDFQRSKKIIKVVCAIETFVNNRGGTLSASQGAFMLAYLEHGIRPMAILPDGIDLSMTLLGLDQENVVQVNAPYEGQQELNEMIAAAWQ